MQSKVLCRKLRLHSEMLCEVVLQNNSSVVAAVGSVVADAVTNVGATFACFVFIISFLLVVVIIVAAARTDVDTLAVTVVVVVVPSLAVILSAVVEVVEVSVTGLGVIVIAFVVAADEFCFIPTGTVVDILLLIISAATAVAAFAFGDLGFVAVVAVVDDCIG